VLLLKRIVCFRNKCAVFKAGVCVSIPRKVFKHGTFVMHAQQAIAKAGFPEHNLPQENQCSDKDEALAKLQMMQL